MKISRIRNGILFISIGFVLLLNTLDKLDWSIWVQILSLWPVILIAIGIELLVGKTSLGFLGFLSPVLILLAVLGPVYLNQTDAEIPSCFLNEYSWSEKPDSLVTKAVVMLEIQKGKLEISSSQERLISASLKYFGKKPYCAFHYSDIDSSATLEIRERGESWGNLKSSDWKVKLSNQPSFDLKIYSTASSVNLDLSGIRVERLGLDCDLGKAKIKLGNLVPNVKVTVESNICEIIFLVPKETGLAVTSNADLSSIDFDLPLNKDEDSFYTKNYQAAQNKIEIDLQGAISSLKIDTY